MVIRTFENLLPNIHKTAFIDESAVVIGDVTLGENSSVWPNCVIRGDIHSIRIGERTNIQDGSVLHVTHAGQFSKDGAGINIGNGVIIGHSVTLHGCTLEDECLIGIGAIVLDNAIVRKNALVAAGAVVGPGKDLEGGYLWVGNPIRKARELTEKEMAFFEYSANYYVKLKDRHLADSK